MKRIVTTTFCLLSLLVARAQENQMSATFNSAVFYLPESQQAYIETYLSVDAWSCRFVPSGDGYQATIDALLVVRDGAEAVYAKRYTLHSPVIDDSNATDFNFLDVQRFSLPSGLYKLELTLRDTNSDNAAETAAQNVHIDFSPKTPAMSSIQLMANATKTTTPNILSRGGYDMEPYCSDFVPEAMKQLNFYYEIYNIQEEVHSKGLVTYAFIEDATTGQRMGDASVIQRAESSPLIAHYNSIDISQLPTGNYNLRVEVRNHKNELLLYKLLPFFRANNDAEKMESATGDISLSFAASLNDEEQLRNYLDALYPIATDSEKATVAELNRRNNLAEKQAFLYYFWIRRDELKAEQLWNEYRARIDFVDKTFAYPRTPGHRTDRGRVYLQYGPPDFIRDEKNFVGALHLGSGNTRMESGTGHIYYLPYQLWRYNKLDNDDANRVFLFWDELRSNFYKLLASNAIGETWDPYWERRLSQNQLGEDVVGEVGEQFNRGY